MLISARSLNQARMNASRSVSKRNWFRETKVSVNSRLTYRSPRHSLSQVG